MILGEGKKTSHKLLSSKFTPIPLEKLVRIDGYSEETYFGKVSELDK